MYWLYQSAVNQRQALQRGEISALELVEATIKHTESLIPYLNPIALKLYDRAREYAFAADKMLARGKGGPLCGIPVTIKDSQWLAGYPCANGSVALKDFVPQETSQSIQRLEDAGAVIFAKTTCPELSLSGITSSALYGTTSNPWNTARTPGGSSGGAGAAVAAGMGALSLGGDGGGSIRIPAAFCGITGLKPGYGVIPRKPGFKTWESIVAYGPMARNVGDVRLMFDVLSAQKHHKPRFQSDKFTLVASEDLGFAPVDDDVRQAFLCTVEKIVDAGHEVKLGNPGLGSSVVPWAVTATYDMWRHKKEALESGRDLGLYAQEFIKFGSTFSESEHEDAQTQRSEIHNRYMEFFRRYETDILVTPTLGCEAFSHDTIHPERIGNTDINFPWLDWAGFLYDANLVGMPACSIPMGIGDEGLPMSLQILGAPGTDLKVLDVAEMIEELIQWEQPMFGVEHYELSAASENGLTPTNLEAAFSSQSTSNLQG